MIEKYWVRIAQIIVKSDAKRRPYIAQFAQYEQSTPKGSNFVIPKSDYPEMSQNFPYSYQIRHISCREGVSP